MKKILVLVIALFLLSAGPASADPVLGRWDPPQPQVAPTTPIHFAVLPNGRLLVWSGEMVAAAHSHTAASLSGEYVYVWDPKTGVYTQGPSFPDLFCSGHAFLPGGALLVAGGIGTGAGSFMLYRDITNTWGQGPAMQGYRYYPTNVPLADGHQLILGGRIGGGKQNPLPQIWNPAIGGRI